MPETEVRPPESSPYVHIQAKLDEPFSPNDLCKSWVVEWLANNDYGKKALRVHTCGTKAVSLACVNGHQKRVRMTCQLEICPRCGKKGSLAHRKRYLRALDRLVWAPVLGYLVFTLPREVSDSMPSREQLSQLEKEAVRIVQLNFSTPGCMARVHFMGEEISQLHIHINVLFPIVDTNRKGEVSQATLHNIRQQWTTFVNQAFKLNNNATNIFYKFATTDMQMRHKLKYVTRGIVIAEKFLSLSNEAKRWYLSLAGWHNTRWYGQLSNHKYKKYLEQKGFDLKKHEEEDIALSKKCPVCRQDLKYKEIIDVNDIPFNQFRRLDPDTWVDLEIYSVLKNKASP